MDLTTRLSEIATLLPDSIDVLDRFNLDYYCYGGKSFVQACTERKLDADLIWKEIMNTRTSQSSTSSLENWEPAVLRELIRHHYGNLNNNAPSIDECLGNLYADCSSVEHAQIDEIKSCFNSLVDFIGSHAHSEEVALQPVLSEQTLKKQRPDITRKFIRELEYEHGYIGSLIYTLRQRTTNYAMDGLSSSCAQVTGMLLHQFDKDITQRIHLENNLLFPKLT